MLLESWGLEALLEGLAILKKALPGVHLHLALHHRRQALAARIEEAAGRQGLSLELYGLAGKYPAAHRAILVPALLGRAVAQTALLDLQALLHLRDAVVLGKPMLERVVALAGTGFPGSSRFTVCARSPLTGLWGEAACADCGSCSPTASASAIRELRRPR